ADEIGDVDGDRLFGGIRKEEDPQAVGQPVLRDPFDRRDALGPGRRRRRSRTRGLRRGGLGLRLRSGGGRRGRPGGGDEEQGKGLSRQGHEYSFVSQSPKTEESYRLPET